MWVFYFKKIFIDMIQDILRSRYEKYLTDLDIYENKSSLILSRIEVKPEFRNVHGLRVGSNIMEDLCKYADANNQIIALTPSGDFGGNVKRLIKFYQFYGFRWNRGPDKNFEFQDTMLRVPKMNETMKPIIKQLLREGLITKTEDSLKNVSNFVNFAKEHLNITDDIKVALAYERTPDLTTTAYYNLDGLVKVYVKDRAFIDICRSIAHELVHHKQNIEGRLSDAKKDGSDGSDIENEANAVAGVIIRKWGKIHPEFYY